MNGLRECACKIPRESTNPRSVGKCVTCGFVINPRWISSDETVGEFFDTLERIPGMGNIAHVRREAEDREREGRPLYGHGHLAQNPVKMGCEEASDGCIYSLFVLLKARREGRDEPTAQAFEAARHFALAHRALIQARWADD